MHQDFAKVASPDELQRYLSRPDDHAALMRFAGHVHGRDSTNVWAPTVLAEHASEPEERLYYLLAAIEAGRKHWDAVAQVGEVAWWDNVETQSLMEALHSCARIYAELGMSDDAVICIKELLEMDPDDRIGAEALATEVGLISVINADAGYAFAM
jgi:tetratricopeptide (TPR) repeat protein